MTSGVYALALAAGLVAALNPCGFALLPAYLSLLVAGDGPPGRLRAVGRGLRMTAAMTTGFVAVFGLFGAVVVPAALSVQRYLPWATILIGLVLTGLGLWLFAGRGLNVPGARVHGGAPGSSVWSMTVYGVAYAVASLSCTIGPLLAILSTTVRTAGVVEGVLALVVYGLGMGIVVGVLSVAVALAQDSVVSRLRLLLPYAGRAGGALLTIAGGYVAYYGWYEVRVFSGGGTDDPVVAAALQVQARLAEWVAEAGATTLLVLLLGLVAVAGAASYLRGRR